MLLYSYTGVSNSPSLKGLHDSAETVSLSLNKLRFTKTETKYSIFTHVTIFSNDGYANRTVFVLPNFYNEPRYHILTLNKGTTSSDGDRLSMV